MPLLDVVLTLVSSYISRVIGAQIVWFMARHCETVWSRAAVTGTSPSGCSLQWVGFDEALSTQHDLDKRLCAYVDGCKTARMDWQFMTVVTDKGDGGGLPLQQSVFAFPDNMAFYGVPQVAPWAGGGPECSTTQ